MQLFQTPNSPKSTSRNYRKPFSNLNNYSEFQQSSNYLKTKISALEMRVKNINSNHVSENRSTNTSKTTANLSPKEFKRNLYYESIISKRQQNFSKLDHSPSEQSTTHNKYSLLTHQIPAISNLNIKVQNFTKKLREFQIHKTQESDIIMTKIKQFCDQHFNECFDFYRSTDLMSLKYFIYLIIQEINSNGQETARSIETQNQQNQIQHLKSLLENQKLDQTTNQSQQKFKKVIIDTQNVIQSIILQLQQQHNQNMLTNQVQMLKNQIQTLNDVKQQQSFRLSFGMRTSSNIDSENNPTIANQSTSRANQSTYRERFKTSINSKSKSPFNVETPKKNKLLEEQQRIIQQLLSKIPDQQQLDGHKKTIEELEEELNKKNQLIVELEDRIQNEEAYLVLNQRILDINKNLDNVISQNQSLIKENDALKYELGQLRFLEEQYYALVKENKILQQSIINNDCQYDKILQQFELECKNYRQQILKLQETCETQQAQLQGQEEQRGLQYQLSQFDKLKKFIREEAQGVGQVITQINQQLQKQLSDIMPNSIKQLQKDLAKKKCVIEEKILSFEQLQDEDCELGKVLNKQENDELKLILLMQSLTIEKMIDL
ncbi:unnamed protein product (macronuclear) [Paramecium tetraurelia]|uniref:Uncharacterized protein n=1 Tax=Paramecium tetraurelia TaxID=5888 RepID=A0D073_PARTE|nr:uncharacterized protein GSPATT00011992001 [Paramecium tetraurelia]CAK76440.1 unnamed protein product [Paramecium tetraurelia]|eukprot:XP_001443837.1 hypothetical protein (macronuclear) [Paramecium tetraurelia strain d4-2]